MNGLLASPDVAIPLTGFLVGVSSALLGTFLVLRGAAMLADAISHSIVLGIAVVWIAAGVASGPLQLVGAALTGLVTVGLTQALTASGRVRDDAAIGLVFPALFSGGVLLLGTFAHDVHIDAHTVLLGEIGFVWLDTVEVLGVEVPRGLLAMAVMTGLDAAFVAAFFKELKLAIFDPEQARMQGFAPDGLFLALLALTSATAVAAFDAVGVVLFVAFVIVPPATALLVTGRLGAVLVVAVAVSAASVGTGHVLALAWDVSIGGMMAAMTGAFLVLAGLFGPRRGVLAVRRPGS